MLPQLAARVGTNVGERRVATFRLSRGVVVVPSPRAGEGDAEVQQAPMGEGLRPDPSPYLCRCNAACPLPQGRGQARGRRAAWAKSLTRGAHAVAQARTIFPTLHLKFSNHPSRRSYSRTALSRTCAPAAHSSKLVDSASLCEMPPRHGTKIMVVGATRAT